MTPTDPTPLSAEELAEVRADLDRYPTRYDGKRDGLGPHDPVVYARRLLATLDARELDVLERLQRFSYRAEVDGKVDAEHLRKAIAALGDEP